MRFAVASTSRALLSQAGIQFASPEFKPWLAPLAGWLQRRASARQAADRAPAALAGPCIAELQSMHPQPRTLRVLRVADGASRQCAGRMVISGRMADVCAELDRLVAREAQRNGERRVGAN